MPEETCILCDRYGANCTCSHEILLRLTEQDYQRIQTTLMTEALQLDRFGHHAEAAYVRDLYDRFAKTWYRRDEDWERRNDKQLDAFNVHS